MKNKSIISTILLFAVCFFYLPAYATEGKQTNFDEQISFLRAIGIVNSETYSAEELITKREAVSMIMLLLGMDESVFGHSGKIKDINEKDNESGLLNAAVELGISELDANRLFNPNSLISYADAAKMVFTALGYNRTVDSPNSNSWYLKLASENKLDANVRIVNGGKLTKSEWAGIIYNAAHIPIMQGINFGPISKYKASDDATALSEYHKIFKIIGNVTSNSLTSLREKSGAGKNTIIIDGVRIQTDEISVDEESLLGKEVKAYYRQDEEELSLVYVCESGKTEVISLVSDDLIDFDINNYIYTYGGTSRRKSTISLSKSAAVIYNGVAVTGADYKMLNKPPFMPKTGEVEIIRSKDSNTYDIVKIKSYINYVVERVSKTENLIFDKYGNETINISPESIKNVNMHDLSGEQLTISNLDEWDVASAAVSLGKEYIEIVVSGNAVKGIITEIADDTLCLEAEEFELSNDLISNKSRIPEVGTSIVAYFDKYGKAAAVQIQPSGEWQVGYLIKAGRDKSLDDVISFKLLTQENKIEYVNSKFPLVVDGDVYKSSVGLDSLIGTKGIIRYQLNKEGNIKRIDTPAVGAREDSYTLKQRYSGSYKYKNYIPTFGGVIFPKSSAMVFTVPTDADAKERDYKVETLSSFVHDSTYDVVAYAIGDNDLTEDIILHKKAARLAQSSREVMTLVTKIINALDEDGVSVKKVYGMNSGGNREWTIYSDNPNTATLIEEKDIKPGDLIRVTADNRMIVSRIEKVFDGTSKTMHEDIGATNPNTVYDSVFTVAYGKVINRANGLIQVELYNDTKTIQKYKEGGMVFVCEDSKKIHKGSFDDITPGVSSIVVDMNYSRVRTITIYK